MGKRKTLFPIFNSMYNVQNYTMMCFSCSNIKFKFIGTKLILKGCNIISGKLPKNNCKSFKLNEFAEPSFEEPPKAKPPENKKSSKNKKPPRKSVRSGAYNRINVRHRIKKGILKRERLKRERLKKLYDNNVEK